MTDNPTHIERIIYKHVHDVKNSINCVELLAGMIADIVTDPTAVPLLETLRAELTQLEATVNSLQFKFSEPRPYPITADDLMELWKRKIAPLENATHPITWSPPVAPATLTVDVNVILSILRELVIGGWYRSSGDMLQAAVSTTETSVLATVKEPRPRTPPEDLDIEEARRLVEMNRGTLDVSEDAMSGERTVTIKFPAESKNS